MVLRPTSQDPDTILKLVERLLRAQPLTSWPDASPSSNLSGSASDTPTKQGQRDPRFPIARLRYTNTRDQWSLYWRDRNLKFHEYDLAEASSNVQDLLDEIDRDPTAIFWG